MQGHSPWSRLDRDAGSTSCGMMRRSAQIPKISAVSFLPATPGAGSRQSGPRSVFSAGSATGLCVNMHQAPGAKPTWPRQQQRARPPRSTMVAHVQPTCLMSGGRLSLPFTQILFSHVFKMALHFSCFGSRGGSSAILGRGLHQERPPGPPAQPFTCRTTISSNRMRGNLRTVTEYAQSSWTKSAGAP